MATITSNPTSNTTPDPGQGGLAVTGATNTGHSNTTASAINGGSQSKSCKWTGFQSVSGQILSITLKVDWSESGSTEGGGRQFKCDYSLNGGSSWTTLFNHSPLSVANGTAQASLSVGQDLSQIQVRDFLEAISVLEAVEAVTGSISGIRLEIITQDQTHLLVMM
jgi:hypothetical protein